MRTGANFARGSCRALKWMVLLGVLSVLGSTQAAAQAPTIETASYEKATSRELNIKMSRPVFFTGTNPSDLLPGDFALAGGSIGAFGATGTTPLVPIRIDGLPVTISSADDEFTLVFREDLATKEGTDANPLLLTYTQDPATDVQIFSENRVALATIEAASAIVVTGPDQASALRFTLTAAQRKELEKPRATESIYATEANRVGQPTYKHPITLPRATGVSGGTTVAYAIVNTAVATRLGLTLGPARSTTDNPTIEAREELASRQLVSSGTAPALNKLPAVIGSWQLEVSATVGTAVEVIAFTITVAEEPDTPAEPTVAAASPSSLKVTWKPPNDNNSPIIGYELQYKSETGSWPADDEFTRIAPASTYTISGLAPGTYDVRVRAVNELDGIIEETEVEAKSAWSPVGSGSTGAGPGTPTLVLDVDSTIPEGRNQIPVTVKADVPPSADAPTRSLKVTLTLKAAPKTLAEDKAELPNTNGLPSDLAWAKPVSSTKPLVTVLDLTFASDLSSEGMTYLTTLPDVDAEDETFRITASTTADAVFAKATSKNQNVTIEDAQEQVYALELPVALASSGEIKEGHGDNIVEMNLVVSPARTVPKSFFVNLTSAQDASDYSLTSRGVSSGGPDAVSLRLDVAAGDTEADVMLTSASNDGDRMDDTITLKVFETSATSPTTPGDQVGDDVMLKVVDQHKLPKVTMESIMVDGAEVTSLKEGETGTVTLIAPRGTATDDVPDDEKITIALTHGAASSASAADYSLSSEMVTITAESGTFMLEVLADDEIDAEELVLMAAVTGEEMYGDAADMVALGPISLMDGTTKLVYPKTDEEIQAVIYPAKEAGAGDDMIFSPGEMIEIASPGSLFNTAEGVTLSFSAMSDHDHVATTAVSGGMVTVTAGDEEGMAHITITAHASMPAGAKGLPQTDPSEASIIFPVEVGLEALSFTLMGPEEMNLVEGGMGGMVTATANRAVTADVTINLMRDRAMSTADDMDYTAEAITIEAGMMSGTTMVMATADDMMENEGNMAEELVLYGMAADNAGEVTGQVKFYIWDAAVPALPIIAQLLLAAFLAIGGYRRYRRR